jgi:hypothetical protein
VRDELRESSHCKNLSRLALAPLYFAHLQEGLQHHADSVTLAGHTVTDENYVPGEREGGTKEVWRKHLLPSSQERRARYGWED